MITSVKEYLDSFINDINTAINWKYLKSSRKLKKQIGDIVFEINFYSSKYNSVDSHIEIRSECRVWYRKYDASNTVKSGIAYIAFLEKKQYWWDIAREKDRNAILQSLLQEINTKVIPFTSEMEADFDSGLLHLIYSHGLNAYSNSIQLIDELFGREEAIRAAREYAKSFKPMERRMIKQYANEKNTLVNERNLRYMLENLQMND
ncbi:MAG: hypothetical protein NC331_03550 [Lachnospiraceae bacterium]|nr:hypothetical protein [Lachnospiraceae bacterium]MCM1215690.1 hypothetical protein [Lachnospiraceae bacterium]MCM1238443.1 hypothetical protein [Lachnospiraceae bacterium]